MLFANNECQQKCYSRIDRPDNRFWYTFCSSSWNNRVGKRNDRYKLTVGCRNAEGYERSRFPATRHTSDKRHAEKSPHNDLTLQDKRDYR
jgi:hypothetical protein